MNAEAARRDETITPGERRLALAVTALLLLHAIAGLQGAPIPSWRMFESAYRYEYSLRDRDGRAIALRDWIGPENYLTQPQLVPLLALWLASTRPALAPLELEVTVHHPTARERVALTIRSGDDRLPWSPTALAPTGRPSCSSAGSPSSSR